MKGKDPRDAHFITSRICGICGDNHATCANYAQNMAFGVRPPDLGEWIINLGEAAEYMFDHNIFQDNLVGVDFCEQMVQRDQSQGLGQGREDAGAPLEPAPLPHHRRHHARAESVHGRVLPRSAADEPHDARDVLPDGRPPRASLDAVSGRRRHRALCPAFHRLPDPADEVRRVHEEGGAAARRPVRLLVRRASRIREGGPAARPARLLGIVSGSRKLRLQVRAHDRLGPEDVRHSRRGGGRQAGHQRPGGYQPRHPHPARQLLLRGLAGKGDVRQPRSARQPGGQAPPLEPDHDAAAAEARFRRATIPG